MDVTRYAFLVAILGPDGATALAKAAERSPVLAPVLVPRALLSWLQLQGHDYEGELPGVGNSYLSFRKSGADTLTGVISVGDTSYGFESATRTQLAASIGIALGVDADALDPSLRDVDLQRLGRSIDLLAKARKAVSEISKAEPPGPAAKPVKQGQPVAATAPIKQPKTNTATKKPAKKLDTIGSAAKVPSVKPQASPGAQPPKQADTNPQIKLTRSQAQRPCPVCGLPQFRGERLVGCGCYLELAKSASAVRTSEGYVVTFGPEWEPESIEVFLEGLRGLARQE
jgi:hypothetical protein